MIVNIILLIVGFIILVKSADYFIEGASNLSTKFGWSKLLIGITVIAFGTGLSELSISFQSMLHNSGDLVLGNVIGSNIYNTLLILGVVCMIKPIKVKNMTVKREIPILVLITLLVSVLYLDNFFNGSELNTISRADGIIISSSFLLFIYYIVKNMRNPLVEMDDISSKTKKSIVLIIGSLIAIIFASNLVVDNAIVIANYLGVSQRFISLSIVAFGTSLPELVTSITAIKKQEQELLLGNIIGSNIFNLSIVLGLPVAIFGGITPVGFTYVDISFLLLSSLLLLVITRINYKITRFEGGLLLLLFLIYYISLF